jgi:hypothetical protein
MVEPGSSFHGNQAKLDCGTTNTIVKSFMHRPVSSDKGSALKRESEVLEGNC